MSTPEYVHPIATDQASQNAQILNPNKQEIGNVFHRSGLTVFMK